MLNMFLKVLSIVAMTLYSLFFFINFGSIWARDHYYTLLYYELSICAFIVMMEKHFHFAFINIFLLFFVFGMFPQSRYTMVALAYDAFLFFQLIMTNLNRQEYEEIPSEQTMRVSTTNDYPPAIDARKSSELYQNYIDFT